MIWKFLIICGLLFVIYKIVEISLRHIERRNAMRKLEGADLIAYLGKPEPQTDSHQIWLWRLLRAGSLALGIGISFCLTPLYTKVIQEILGDGAYYSYLVEVVGWGATMVLGAVALIIELLIERKLRK